MRSFKRLLFTKSVLAILAAGFLSLSTGVGQEPDAKDAPKDAPKVEEKAPERAPVPLPPPTRRASTSLPPVEIILGPSEGHAVPNRTKYAHAVGGNINVSQPNPTTVIITMTGLAVARGDCIFKQTSADYHFDLHQCFDVVVNDKDLKGAKLSLEGKVLGRLRSYTECPNCCRKGGTAESSSPATAAIACGDAEIVSVHIPGHSIGACQSETVYNHEGPAYASASAGHYELRQEFGFGAAVPCNFLLKASSADFTPELFLDLRQFGFAEPINGSANKDFGFTVTIKAIPE